MASRFQTRNRTASPPEIYMTAADDSFNLHNDDILHSTAQMDLDHSELGHPGYSQYAASESGSIGSTDMSIEIGRGLKRDASHKGGNDDQSSNFRVDMGNDSIYEIMNTPPIPQRSSARKHDGTLRREAAIRSASTVLPSARSVSNPVHNTSRNTEEPTATIQPRNTRFQPRARHISANNSVAAPREIPSQNNNTTPRRGAATNQTVHSVTYTANSFALPDLPNITELVSGTRKDGTPVFTRTANPKSNRRFVSGSSKLLRPDHVPVDSVATPDEEKQIYASLQLLQDRILDLEMDKSEAQQKEQEYENQIIELQSQLYAEQRRPNSALGSDDGQQAQEKSRKENTRLQATVKSLQDRLDRSERKVSVAEISVRRMTKERDEVVTQIAIAYFNNEELKTENDNLRKNFEMLQAEHDRLKRSIEPLRKDNEHLRTQLSASHSRKEMLASDRGHESRSRTPKQSDEHDPSTFISVSQHPTSKRQNGAVRSKNEGKVVQEEDKSQQFTETQAYPLQGDLALLIAREVQKHRDQAQDKAQGRASKHSSKSRLPGQDADTQTHHGPVHRRTASMSFEGVRNKLVTTTQGDMTQRTQTFKHDQTARDREQRKPEEEERDLTLLSMLDPIEVANLRKQLEQERRERKGAFAPASQPNETIRSMSEPTQNMTRKSSLKDIFAGLSDETGTMDIPSKIIADARAKVVKSVRVQSPHTSDDLPMPPVEQDTGDVSIVSNTSRRRRAVSAENMTLTFNLPEAPGKTTKETPILLEDHCIQHNAASCTACHPENKDMTIPTPIPVTERVVPEDPDITSITVRPSQAPTLALATVIKQLEDEIKHLKIRLAGSQSLYNQHMPALSKRKRMLIKSTMERLTVEVEKRSNQVYDLYDVLEGQKQAALDAEKRGEALREMDQEEVDQTLSCIGIDPVELAGRVGRQHKPSGHADEYGSDNETGDLPWEGLSDYESEGGN